MASLEDFKASFYLFDPKPYGRIYAFVDFGNVRPWAKELWPSENKDRLKKEIDIAKLAALCDMVKVDRKFFYYGHYPQPQHASTSKTEAMRRYRTSIYRIDKARGAGFAVKTKDIKAIPHLDDAGKMIGTIWKCNFDVEITMSLLTKIMKYDTVMLFSGDSDFGGLLSYLKNKGKRVIVVCTRRNMSKELEQVADLYIPAEALASQLELVTP